jgi:hypothetical protein
MSFNDYARLSNKDLELYNQLSDLSYRSVNGKRQSARNFKEGVLNLGQIYFEQPKDVLTKEMILDYQKEQQNKPAYIDTTTGDKFQYVPSNVNEPLNPYNIVNLPSGAPATEGDINLKKNDLNIVYSNLDILSSQEREIAQLINDLRLKVNKLNAEEFKLSSKLNDDIALEQDTQNRLNIVNKDIPFYVNKLSTLKRKNDIDKCKIKIDELEKEKKKS